MTTETHGYRRVGALENVFIEIEKQDPEGASRAMIEHFEIMESRARECKMVRATAEGN